MWTGVGGAGGGAKKKRHFVEHGGGHDRDGCDLKWVSMTGERCSVEASPPERGLHVRVPVVGESQRF